MFQEHHRSTPQFLSFCKSGLFQSIPTYSTPLHPRSPSFILFHPLAFSCILFHPLSSCFMVFDPLLSSFILLAMADLLPPRSGLVYVRSREEKSRGSFPVVAGLRRWSTARRGTDLGSTLNTVYYTRIRVFSV